MSLGLISISAFSGMITAFGLYFGGHVSFVEGLGAYSLTGVLVAVVVSLALALEMQTAKR